MDLKNFILKKYKKIDVGYEYMKKVKLLCLSILGLLFLIPLVNFSTAASGDYVGVKEGDSYSWKLTMNINAINALVEDAGGTFEELEDLEGLLPPVSSLTFTATVKNVLPEDTMMVNSTLVTYVPINVTLSAIVPGYGSGEIGTEIVSVFSNETDHYLHMMLYAFESPYLTFVFVAQNLDWTKVVEDVQDLFGLNPIYQNVVLTEESNGIKLVVPEGEFNATQKEMELKMTYNSKGVISYAGFKYDGVTAISLTLSGGEEEIPGYMLPIIMGTIAVVGIGLIYSIKKKNII